MILIFKVHLTMTLLHLLSQCQSHPTRQRRQQDQLTASSHDRKLSNHVPSSTHFDGNLSNQNQAPGLENIINYPMNDKAPSIGSEIDYSRLSDINRPLLIRNSRGTDNNVAATHSLSENNGSFKPSNSDNRNILPSIDIASSENPSQSLETSLAHYQNLFDQVLARNRSDSRSAPMNNSPSSVRNARKSQKYRRKMLNNDASHSNEAYRTSNQQQPILDGISKKRAYLAKENTAHLAGLVAAATSTAAAAIDTPLPQAHRLRHGRAKNRLRDTRGRHKPVSDAGYSYPLDHSKDNPASIIVTEVSRESREKETSLIPNERTSPEQGSMASKRAMANYRSLCASETRTVVLNNSEYDYEPPFYSETLCFHKYKNGTAVTSHKQRCAVDFLDCVQQHQVLRFTRRRTNSADRWEPYSLEVPSRCECMWPLHQNGPIKLHHDHEDL